MRSRPHEAAVTGVVVGTAGATALEGADAGLSPTAFVATTVTVYEVPLVRPAITQPSWVEAVHVLPPGAAVALNMVIGELPSLNGAAHDTTSAPFAEEADALRGALGNAGGSAATKLQFNVAAPRRPFHPSIAILYSVPSTTFPTTLLHKTEEFGASSFIPRTLRLPIVLPE